MQICTLHARACACARGTLGRVASAEADTIEAWLAYGAALIEGRGLFHPEDDRGFGQWLYSSNLEEKIHPADKSAAMWAAANPPEFDTARQALVRLSELMS